MPKPWPSMWLVTLKIFHHQTYIRKIMHVHSPVVDVDIATGIEDVLINASVVISTEIGVVVDIDSTERWQVLYQEWNFETDAVFLFNMQVCYFLSR